MDQTKNLHLLGSLDFHSRSRKWLSMEFVFVWIFLWRASFVDATVKSLLPFNAQFNLFSPFVGSEISKHLWHYARPLLPKSWEAFIRIGGLLSFHFPCQKERLLPLFIFHVHFFYQTSSISLWWISKELSCCYIYL